MHGRRNLGWRLNWYRQSELDGALLLGARAPRRGTVPRPAAHETLRRRGAARVAVGAHDRRDWLCRPCGSAAAIRVLLDEIGSAAGIIEALALTHVFEQRVHAHFSESCKAGTPGSRAPDIQQPVARRGRPSGLDRRWLKSRGEADAILQPVSRGRRTCVSAAGSYRDRLWEIDGLRGHWRDGELMSEATQEPHTAERQHSTQALA